LSQLISNILTPLVTYHVEAHLKSTTQFIAKIKDQPLGTGQSFGSLDVTNLYGSIPIEDCEERGIPGVVTVVSNFFTTYRNESLLPELDPIDFNHLVRLCLCEDQYLFNGQLRTQKKGIAMGNCAAPALAIIYMDEVEKAIHTACPSIVFWKRYIDDIFFISEGDGEELLAISNAVNPYIQFTLEKPVGNTLAFLDTMVHGTDGRFTYELHFKPSHSGTCLPFDSFTPPSRKNSLIISEFIRAQRNSSPVYLQQSIAKVNHRLQQNGYPQRHIQRMQQKISTNPKEKAEYLDFIKIPYRCLKQRKQIIQAAHRTGMHEQLRIVFLTERSLGWQFRPKHEVYQCPDDCTACATATRPTTCFTKNAIYKIQCSVCSAIYIGQTSRTMRSRISEHSKTPASHVFQHMRTHGPGNHMRFQWSVVTTHPYASNRLAIEALQIKRERNLMNGCEGSTLLPFLAR
jgi:hypothetical protein